MRVDLPTLTLHDGPQTTRYSSLEELAEGVRQAYYEGKIGQDEWMRLTDEMVREMP